MDEYNLDKKKCLFIVGLLAMLLPGLSLLGSHLVEAINFSSQYYQEYSISDSIYLSAQALDIVLGMACLMLFIYHGYDTFDYWFSSFIALCGIGLLIFTDACPYGSDKVGFFQLSQSVSAIIHTCCACSFLILLTVLTMFRFTKSSGEMTEAKKKRNLIYRINGCIAIAAVILLNLPIEFYAKVWVCETITLLGQGFSCIVKSQLLPIFRD